MTPSQPQDTWREEGAPGFAGEVARSGSEQQLPQAGELVGGYRIEALLGRGGMGAVFAATRAQQRVALKVILSQDPEARLRFEREGQAAAAVDRHPHIVRVHSAGIDGQRLFIVFDLIEGATLASVIAGRGPMPEDEALALLTPIVEAVAFAHRHGIIHRDLKPANILIRAEDGAPLVADFGLARSDDAQALTHTGELLGTPAYMAPEQIVGGAVGPAADVWALGVLLHELVAGERPFTGKNLIEISTKVLSGARPELRRLGLSAGLREVLEGCLESDPAARWADAGALAAALDGARPVRRSPRWPWLALALSGAAVVVAALALRPGAPKPRPAAQPEAYAPVVARLDGLTGARWGAAIAGWSREGSEAANDLARRELRAAVHGTDPASWPPLLKDLGAKEPSGALIPAAHEVLMLKRDEASPAALARALAAVPTELPEARRGLGLGAAVRWGCWEALDDAGLLSAGRGSAALRELEDAALGRALWERPADPRIRSWLAQLRPAEDPGLLAALTRWRLEPPAGRRPWDSERFRGLVSALSEAWGGDRSAVASSLELGPLWEVVEAMSGARPPEGLGGQLVELADGFLRDARIALVVPREAHRDLFSQARTDAHDFNAARGPLVFRLVEMGLYPVDACNPRYFERWRHLVPDPEYEALSAFFEAHHRPWERPLRPERGDERDPKARARGILAEVTKVESGLCELLKSERLRGPVKGVAVFFRACAREAQARLRAALEVADKDRLNWEEAVRSGTERALLDPRLVAAVCADLARAEEERNPLVDERLMWRLQLADRIPVAGIDLWSRAVFDAPLGDGDELERRLTERLGWPLHIDRARVRTPATDHAAMRAWNALSVFELAERAIQPLRDDEREHWQRRAMTDSEYSGLACAARRALASALLHDTRIQPTDALVEGFASWDGLQGYDIKTERSWRLDLIEAYDGIPGREPSDPRDLVELVARLGTLSQTRMEKADEALFFRQRVYIAMGALLERVAAAGQAAEAVRVANACFERLAELGCVEPRAPDAWAGLALPFALEGRAEALRAAREELRRASAERALVPGARAVEGGLHTSLTHADARLCLALAAEALSRDEDPVAALGPLGLPSASASLTARGLCAPAGPKTAEEARDWLERSSFGTRDERRLVEMILGAADSPQSEAGE